MKLFASFFLGFAVASAPLSASAEANFEKASKCVDLATFVGGSIAETFWVVASLKSDSTREQVLQSEHFRAVISGSVDPQASYASGSAVQSFLILGLDEVVEAALKKGAEVKELTEMSPALAECASGAQCNSSQALTDLLIAPMVQGRGAVQVALRKQDFSFKDEPEKSLGVASQFAGLLARSCSVLLEEN